VVAGDPCANPAFLALECQPVTDPSDPTDPALASWAWIHAVSGQRTYDLRSGYVTPDPAFPEDATTYAGDDGVAVQGGCDQLAVISARTDDALFGGIAGATDYSTVARSVGRVRISVEGDGAPAFLMLERTRCDALSEQVGSGELGIVVDAATAVDPGIIHVDSKGSPATGCNGNNNASGWAVCGDDSSSPKIVANGTSGGVPGIVAIHALQVGLPPVAYGGSTLAGIEPDPTPARIVSRKPIDDKYNSSGEPSITALHASAVQYVNGTTPPPDTYPSARPGPWTTMNACNGSPPAGATKVFVNCTGGFSASNPSTFAAATDVIFNGPVDVANNRQLYFPAARRVIVGGTTSRGLAVAGGGILGVNSVNPYANATAACTGREGPGWAQTTGLVVFGGGSSGGDQGALNVTGQGALCQTFVYLAGPKSLATYSPRQITDGTYDVTCTTARPCPLTTSANPVTNANLIVAGLLQWSAPNQLTTQPAAGSVGFEDLALWTETATLSELRSGGDLRARGVYFLPNDRVEFRSPASASPQDAQFVARSLALLQGTLRMRPTPGNVVLIPVLGGVGMVR
jgi:hypothetical protein